VTARAVPSSGDQLRHLIAQLSDGVLVVDRDGSLLFLNPAAEHLLGRPATELIGENIGLPVYTAGVQVELELVTSDGSERVAEMQVAEVEWDGEPAFVASLRDVTERKRLEERHRRASQTLETIVEASPLPVLQLGPDFSLNFWNRAADELFVEPDQLSRGLPFPPARDPQNHDLFRIPERLGRGEKRVTATVLYQRPAGDTISLEVLASGLRDHDGSVTGLVVMLREPAA
jgi:PAS domain-containing protein